MKNSRKKYSYSHKQFFLSGASNLRRLGKMVLFSSAPVENSTGAFGVGGGGEVCVFVLRYCVMFRILWGERERERERRCKQ